jgi:hypothetical protein
MIMTLRKKRVRTLHDRLKIIHEVEKNPGEKPVDIAKRLGLPASTLNSIFPKENKISEQIQKCVTRARREKLVRSRHLLNWKWCFAETYEALEKVKACFYAHSVTDADRENILSLEKSYFQLRQNSAKKQKMGMA